MGQAPRALGTPQLTAARDDCANRLSALGYEVTRQSFGLGDRVGQNVIGTLRGEEYELRIRKDRVSLGATQHAELTYFLK